jgi:hypothetical protein
LEQVSLGSIGTFVLEIKRIRSLFVIVGEISYLSCRQLLEELTELLVLIDLSSDFLDPSILVLLVFLPSLEGISLSSQEGQLLVNIKCSRLFEILQVCVFKYSRETDA